MSDIVITHISIIATNIQQQHPATNITAKDGRYW